MDYDTFSESHMHSRRPIEHLINLVRTRVDSTPAFTLLLGAGASITSGVRDASSLMEEWRRRCFASANTNTPYEAWLAQQDWYETEDEYSRLFELVYDQPSQRRAFIERIVNSARPSWGYAYLASLIEKGVINTIFTTNFDDLINEACFQFGQKLRPLVCAHDSAVGSIRLMSERPKVVKLHGDFLYDSIKNTSSELSNLEANMREKFMEFAREFGMIVVGYSGSDKSVMDVLSVLARSPGYFRNGVYWCIRKDATPGPRLRHFLRHERVYWVEVDGFDELMASMADGLGLELPLGITSPYQVALSRSSHLFGEDSSDTHPLIYREKGRLHEVHTRVSQLLKDAGLIRDSDTGKEQSVAEMTGEIESYTLPILQAHAAIDCRNHARAESLLRSQVENGPKDRRWQARFMLLDCLLDSGDRRDDIRAILDVDFSASGSSDDFARCAYYALFINEPVLAMTFIEKALALNAGSSLALVNKGLAHLQLGDSAAIETIAETLIAPRMQDRYRAAGYAMTGQLDAMVSPLQRSFALRDYTPRSALRDVAFRPYWQLPRFTEALQPFAKKQELTAPRLEYYPLSDFEQRLADRLLSESEASVRAV